MAITYGNNWFNIMSTTSTTTGSSATFGTSTSRRYYASEVVNNMARARHNDEISIMVLETDALVILPESYEKIGPDGLLHHSNVKLCPTFISMVSDRKLTSELEICLLPSKYISEYELCKALGAYSSSVRILKNMDPGSNSIYSLYHIIKNYVDTRLRKYSVPIGSDCMFLLSPGYFNKHKYVSFIEAKMTEAREVHSSRQQWFTNMQVATSGVELELSMLKNTMFLSSNCNGLTGQHFLRFLGDRHTCNQPLKEWAERRGLIKYSDPYDYSRRMKEEHLKVKLQNEMFAKQEKPKPFYAEYNERASRRNWGRE